MRYYYGQLTKPLQGVYDTLLSGFRVYAPSIRIPDVEQARKPAFTTGGRERSGMGFTIMESFMTNLEISSMPGKGTTVHMRRKLQRRQ